MDIARLRRRMGERGLTAIVASSPENVTYASGFSSDTHWSERALSQHYAVVFADHHIPPLLVAPAGAAALAVGPRQAGFDVILYGAFHVVRTDRPVDPPQALAVEMMSRAVRGRSPVHVLASAIRERVSAGRVGVDVLNLTPAYLDDLTRALSGCTVVQAQDLFRTARAIKTSKEIEMLAAAARIAERALLETLTSFREGVAERDLVSLYESRLAREGARPLVSTIAIGERGAYPFYQPVGERRLRPGDFVRFDIGCRLNGYCADIARVAVFGRPADRVRDAYAALLAGERAAIEAVRPTVTAAGIFRVAQDTCRRSGLPAYTRHHCGHSIGLNLYDGFAIAPTEETVLEQGMVFCIELPYYEAGWGGLQVEDLIRVTSTGHERLTTLSQEMFLVS